MGRETQQDRMARFRTWWAGLDAEQRLKEIQAGHVRANGLPARERKELTPNQRKAARRRVRGK
jgi:hypothetical protein